MTDRASQHQILETLTGFLHEVTDEEFVGEIDIGMETSFADHLELESIEFVALSELLQEEYGDRVDFVRWFSDLELDEIIGLKVGDVVRFIEGCL